MRRAPFSTRAAMTLVEMLVAMTATLILMAAVVQAFAAFGSVMSASRAALGTDARLRTAAARLRSDLAGLTAQMLPPRNPGQGEGYFEVIEGPITDTAASDGMDVGPADIDDALLFTTRTVGSPFLGLGPGGRLESTVAEVVWFARPTANTSNPVTYTLYRRQLLVMGYAGIAPFTTGTAPWSSWSTYFNQPCDISARLEGVTLFPNTLADLTRRESRFMHNPAGTTNGSAFPYEADLTQLGSVLSGNRLSDDVILTDILSFDVRVFDPSANVKETSNGTALVPNDLGFVSGGPPAASGCYVDIGNEQGGLFSSGTAILVAGTNKTLTRTYCTWSTHYEANGIDDDHDGVVDQGTDGLDNNGNSLVDEGTEQETSPPYTFPLRGIEVRIRCYEPSSRQVRQVTVRHTFVPH